MNEQPSIVMRRCITALQKYPDHQRDAEDLIHCQNGLLIFFHPPGVGPEQDLAWASTVSDLTVAHPLIRSSGVGVIGVVPPILDTDFFKTQTIPFPVIQFGLEEKLARRLWNLVMGNQTGTYSRCAILLTLDPAESHKWADYDSESLDRILLDRLLEKQLLLGGPEKRGFFLFFHPPAETPETDVGWESAVMDLINMHSLLDDHHIGVAGVVPQITEKDFFQKYAIPFPLFQYEESKEVQQVLWKMAHRLPADTEDSDISRYAVLSYTRGPNKAGNQRILKKEFPDYDPTTIESELLSFLADKNIITYSSDSQFIRLVEKKHLAKRRAKAASEGSEFLQNAHPKFKGQVEAYQHQMIGEPDRPPIGLAFSGGGIRSATFNLGLTQALAKLRLLPWVDYLTSVSGGGFTAGALTSLLSRRTTSQQYFFNTQWEQFPFNPNIEAFRENVNLDEDLDRREDRNFRDVSHKPGHNTQLSHMIKNGNYLIPRLGLATRDLLHGVGSILAGIGFTIFLFTLAMFCLACLHYFSASLLSPVILNDLDTTRLTQEEATSQENLTVNVEIDGATSAVQLPLKTEISAENEQEPASSTQEFSLPYLLFGRYASEPPVLGPDESPNESGQIPWLIYLLTFLAGAGAAYFAYRFLATTYSFPKTPTGPRSSPNTMAKKPAEKRDPFFPNPRHFLRTIWSAFGLAVVTFGWTIASQASLPSLIEILYPLVILLAGVLIWLLLRGVPDNGTVQANRGTIGLVSAGLIALGFALAFLIPSRSFESGTNGITPWVVLPLSIVIFVLLAINIYQRNVDADRWGRQGFDRWEWYDPFILRILLGFQFGILLLVLGLIQTVSNIADKKEVFWLWQPTVFMVGSLTFLIIIRLLIKGEMITWGSPRFRTIIWAFTGMSFYAVIGALLFALLTIPHIFAVGGPEGASPAVPLSAAIFSGLWAAFLTQFVGKDMAGESILKKLFALPAGLRNFVLGLLVVILWFSLIFLFEMALDSFVTEPIQAFGLGLVSAAALVVLGTLLNYNHISLHYFFGDQIAEVFLKTRVEQADGRVATVRDYTGGDLKDISHKEGSAPYHLVVGAINLAGSGHQQDRDRKSRHFLFSKIFVGSSATGYVRTDQYRGGNTKYGSTLALSGAAASPGLGTFTFFAQAFMMTLLNIRLGLWWVNPKEYRGVAGSDDEFRRLEKYEEQAFWPLYLMDEALARTSERRRLVNITDGGHTRDNGGLYPLFERRCKLIIAGDASQDPEGLCHDLFSVLHYIKVDLDIHVDINISRLQPAKESKDGKVAGMSESHCAIGKIHYPAVYRADGSLKQTAQSGWLVYFKPAVSNVMPAEVLQFWQTDKEMFPHPTTADQFFSERQFEAQRRLGEESVRQSLNALLLTYQDSKNKPEDLQKIKTNFLKNVLNEKQIDYELLHHKPEIFNEIMQDLMDAISPLKPRR